MATFVWLVISLYVLWISYLILCTPLIDEEAKA